MNRRTFITSSAAIVTIIPGISRASAQDSTLESRWDDASYLFGNAWDLLPKAKDGEVELLSTIVSPAGSEFGLTALFGLIHNNSDAEAGLTALTFNDGDFLIMSSAYQQIVAPQGYALLTISTTLDLSEAAEPLVLDATFGSVEDVQARSTYSDNIPLQIDTAEITDDGTNASLINATETNVGETGISGLVLWFDDQGALINGASLGDFESLAAGESRQTENYLFAEFDPAAPFLMGYFGYPD